MIFTIEAITNIAKTYSTGHVLQFAIAVGRAGQAIKRMIGDIELHDIAPQSRYGRSLCTDFHAFFDQRCAGSRIAAAAFDFNYA